MKKKWKDLPIKKTLKTVVQFVLNPHFLLCFGIGWMITNGWSYVLLGLGTFFDIEWMMVVSAAYLAFLWIPFTPEKIVTVAIAMLLLRWIFPRDEKTLGILKNLYAKVMQKEKEIFRRRKEKWTRKRAERREKKEQKRQERQK